MQAVAQEQELLLIQLNLVRVQVPGLSVKALLLVLMLQMVPEWMVLGVETCRPPQPLQLREEVHVTVAVRLRSLLLALC